MCAKRALKEVLISKMNVSTKRKQTQMSQARYWEENTESLCAACNEALVALCWETCVSTNSSRNLLKNPLATFSQIQVQKQKGTMRMATVYSSGSPAATQYNIDKNALISMRPRR
mmetsp:Transcript_40102/g.69232  ORF Transcript_40102/g.69232 Transcript_40102/m.69232 type:complete len:115 (-) Transcript_40102:623-967(-)